MIYALADGVRIHRSGDEIRLRKGVWSHQEATLRLAQQPANVVRFLNAVYDALIGGSAADPTAIGSEQAISAEDMERYGALLESLRQQQFLRDVGQRDAARAVSGILGGSLAGFEEQVAPPRPVLFFTDSDYARAAATALAREIRLPLDVMEADLAAGLAADDLTTRTDAVETVEAAARYETVLRPYACVVGCVASPNLSMLRNLNRLLIRAEKPLILGMVDGPFLVVFSALANETGCFECFEQRMLARLEDTAVYNDFIRARAQGEGNDIWRAPQMHTLVSAVLSEAYLYTTLGLMRLAGRLINVYLPLLEIQIQDLLRVPYCPACGHIAQAKMDELYTSTRRIVNDLVRKVEVEG